MVGASMGNTRKLTHHIQGLGWKLTRTTGSHDVFTHSQSPQHIAVPRHKELKAPLVLSILKIAKVPKTQN
jgi:predicted RNA binding protein YcfA (HicA-like mRNA interferase family)